MFPSLILLPHLFAGVLFALKVVNNHFNPGGVTYVMNIRVSNRFASWVELVLIYLIAPGWETAPVKDDHRENKSILKRRFEAGIFFYLKPSRYFIIMWLTWWNNMLSFFPAAGFQDFSGWPPGRCPGGSALHCGSTEDHHGGMCRSECCFLSLCSKWILHSANNENKNDKIMFFTQSWSVNMCLCERNL